MENEKTIEQMNAENYELKRQVERLLEQLLEKQEQLVKVTEQLQKGNIPNVILSRFDEASEKIMNRVEWKNIIDKHTAQVCLNVVRSALASQKISGV